MLADIAPDQGEHRMRLVEGARHGELGTVGLERRTQALDQVVGQEGRVAGRGDHQLGGGRQQARMQAGEGAGEALHLIGDDRVPQSRLVELRGKRISYIPQEPMSNLDPAFTIGSQLVRPMVKVLGISKDEAKQRAIDLLASVGIPDPPRTMAAYPHEVSGGMAQRVLIAGAFSCDPDLIIADEPTTALDVTVQAEVLDVLRELQDRVGLGVVMVTHNFGVVADICDRVVVMQDGRVVEQGAVRQILRDPREQYTKMLLDSTLEDKEPLTRLLVDAGEGSA